MKMSNYQRAAYDPDSGTVRAAWWLDDYFGRHQYGVQFREGAKVYTPTEVEIPLDVVFEPAARSKLPQR